MSADAPHALQQEWIICSVAAAVKYRVPANIVLAVAEKEGGRPEQWRANKNGTQDVGIMQFNTAYLNGLARYGIAVSDAATAGCYSFDLAAWRLRQHIHKDKGDMWTRAANYHSRTPQYNQVYRADLIRKAAKWADWLDARFVTSNMLQVSLIQFSKQGAQLTGSGVDPAGENGTVLKAPEPRPKLANAEYVPRTIRVKSNR